MVYIKSLNDIDMQDMQDVQDVGGKNASLGEMTRHLTETGIRVPQGFAITAAAYRHFLESNHLVDDITKVIKTLKTNDIPQLEQTGEKIRESILHAQLPEDLITDIEAYYTRLTQGDESSRLAVRSSATAEDLPTASFAGQLDSYLNVIGLDALKEAIKKVYASLFTNRVMSYRADKGLSGIDLAVSVGVQKMVRSDLASSGVMFTLDTDSGFEDVVYITATYGLGETVVQGKVNPDEFYVHKPTLRQGNPSIIRRKLGSKKEKLITGKGLVLETVNVESEDQRHFSLSDYQILELAQQALKIEEHYKQHMDIEWAIDGLEGEIYIVQARPETVHEQREKSVITRYHLEKEGSKRAVGQSVGNKVGYGRASVIIEPSKMQRFKAGDVLVTDMTDPDWEPVMKLANGIVTNRGGRTCHAAIIARELGIPAVVGCGDATKTIQNGELITVSCAQGDVGIVYAGEIPYRVDEIVVDNLPELPVEITMNLANPGQAFAYQFIPNQGVGLARMEFIIANMIGIHPKAITDVEGLSGQLPLQIRHMTSAYASPKEYYLSKLAEGIATISAAFYPKQVIVRFSDFKSNEYANLLGGAEYEPHEENPMIGFRGASRYLSTKFIECFKLECEAILRVRNTLGMLNTQIMLPFVRTVEELKNLINYLGELGLKRGENDLKIYMMCEVPSNVIIAEDFLEHCDGYSIGSNDLTQLTLGLDRDSDLVANLFDERNQAVKVMLSNAIKACRKQNKYVGICGEAPSNYPEFAKWLVKEGITSLSLSPDAIVETWLALGSNEKANKNKT